jgi:hypothetical protein
MRPHLTATLDGPRRRAPLTGWDDAPGRTRDPDQVRAAAERIAED